MRQIGLGCATALAVASLIGSMSPALGASADLEPSRAPALMLRETDITPVLGLSGPFTRDVEEGGRLAPVLCNQANQRLVTGPPSAEKVAVDLIQPDVSSIQQRVYQYSSRSAAEAAFTRTAKRARQCDQRNALPGAGRGHVQVLTTGLAPIQFRGVGGVWTREINAGPAGAVDYDSYTVSLLVGDTVQQVMLSVVDAGRTADVQRSAADTLALALAKRWMSGSSGSR